MKKNILLLFFGLYSTLNAQGFCLDVPLIIKEQSNWCWVATSKCVLDYYGFINCCTHPFLILKILKKGDKL
jgi:hypothetical protein